MARTTGTATEHVLATLRGWPDNEMTLADLYDAADGKFTKENIRQSLERLAVSGKIAKTLEGRSVWWSICEAGPDDTTTPAAVAERHEDQAPSQEPGPTKAIVKRPTMVIPRIRY